MIKKLHLSTSVILTALFHCLFINAALANGPALTPTGGSDYHQGTYSLGWNFTATSNLSVTALGFYDGGTTGLTESHKVGIYDFNCNLITSTTVDPADALVGRFRYHALSTPATLTSGQQYYIAAVTGAEAYLIGASTTGASSDITYGGYSIFGNTQSTSELKCPNGSQSPGFFGDYGPNFFVGTLPVEIPNGPTNDPNKRNTALTMFCNRSGPTLSTAKCTVTVADTGAHQRTLPTGTITWEATDGFFPASAECNITQVALSPGIGSCDVEFTVPTGFAIGSKFPIDAEYPGDSVFNGSNTSHKLIKPGCVSTNPANPCPNSIGLSFTTGTPAVIKAKIKAFVACGGTSTTEATAKADSVYFLPDSTMGGSCSLTGVSAVNVATLLKELSFDDTKAIGDAITNAEASKDTLLYLLKNAAETQNTERWLIMQETRDAIEKLTKDIVNNKASVRKDANAFDKYINVQQAIAFSASKSKTEFNKTFKSKPVSVEIKPDKQKAITFSLPKRTQSLINVFKRAGVSTIPMELTLKAKQKKRKGSASVTESVDFVIE
jgi:hypothetical protein